MQKCYKCGADIEKGFLCGLCTTLVPPPRQQGQAIRVDELVKPPDEELKLVVIAAAILVGTVSATQEARLSTSEAVAAAFSVLDCAREQQEERLLKAMDKEARRRRGY